MTYTIKIDRFEGPFDLLLFFIERDELDIYDIPIAKITDDFLSYIREMDSLNIDLASEFILVAATLMRIKAKMLLPRKELDEEGNEIDPRDELVQRLIEYKQYKAILEDLRTFEEARAQASTRGNASDELHQIATRALVDVELESVTLFKLLKAFSQVIERFNEEQRKAVHTVARYNYTVQDQQALILESLQVQQRADFASVFGACENRIHAIVTFLALLELLNRQRIHITPGMGTNNFWISMGNGTDEEE
ncbi:MAG: segregation/condensation protein A [Saprospiraceae bacterium]|nr:segregation/condensation protein A [Saprospiraceae bacterium]